MKTLFLMKIFFNYYNIFKYMVNDNDESQSIYKNLNLFYYADVSLTYFNSFKAN